MIPRIKDTVDILDGGVGIFQTIYSMNIFTWLTEDLSKAYDLDYYVSYSSDKKISRKYFEMLRLEDEGKIPSALSIMAKILVNRHKNDWDTAYDMMNTKYNPLDSYNIEDKETPDITKTRKNDFKSTTDTKSNLFGFNTESSDGVPVSVGSVEVSGDSDHNIITDTETGTRTRTKKGYDTHPSENIFKQLEVMDINLFEILAKDVDSVLVNLFYNIGGI